MRGRSLINAVALTLLAPAPGLAQGRTWEWDGMHPMMFMWGAGGLVMMLMMLVFWGLIVAGLVIGLRWLLAQGRPGARDEALETLRQRMHAAKSTSRNSIRGGVISAIERVLQN